MTRSIVAALAMLLVAVAVREPASAQNYLAPTLDIQRDPAIPTSFHPDIVAKANELQTPLRIFRFVHDEIAYDVYYGSKKGALGALWSGRANDLDQASLLIGLLRARGYKARYVIGVVDAPMEQAKNWAGTKFADMTHRIFFFAYCNAQPTSPACAANPARFVYDPQNDETIRMEHAWVEVESRAVYRGVETGSGLPGSNDPVWIPLDPSWKRKSYQDGIADIPIADEAANGTCQDDPGTPEPELCFRYDDYYSDLDSRLPSEIWKKQVRGWLADNRPGTTLADVPFDGPILPYEPEVLPLSLPFTPAATPALIHTDDLTPYDAPTYRRRYRVLLKVRPANLEESAPFDTRELVVPDVIDERLTISFVPGEFEVPVALHAAMEVGGYLGGPYNGFSTLFEFCLNASPDTPQCLVRPALWRDGVRDLFTAAYGHYPLGWPFGVLIRLDQDLVPGKRWSQFSGGAPVDYTVPGGTHAAIALDVDAVGEAQVRHRIDKLLELRESNNLVDEGDADLNGNGVERELLLDQGQPGIQNDCDYADADADDECDLALSANYKRQDDFIGELLYLVNLRYFQRLREEERELAAIDRAVEIRPPWIGITKSAPVLDYLFDHPVGVLGERSVTDVRGMRVSHVDIDVDCLTNCSLVPIHREARLLTHVASALEHQVWEEFTGREFLSTMKGMQVVRSAYPTQELLRVDSTNVATFRTTLDAFPFAPISDLARDKIEEGPYTNGGFTLTPLSSARGEAGTGDVFYGQYPMPDGTTTHKASIVYAGQVLGGGIPFELDLLSPISFGVDPYDLALIGWESSLGYDPVSMVSGNNFHEERDLAIKTNGPPITFARAYNSQSQLSGELGFGWTHTYEQRVEAARQEQELAYLPTSLSEFEDLNDVEGARSDSFDSWNAGRNPMEKVTWAGLPSAFTNEAIVDARTLELAYEGAFSFEVWQGGVKRHGPIDVPISPFSRRLERFALPATIEVGQAFEVRLLTHSTDELVDFDASDILYFARVMIGFRGPAIERVELPVAPSSTTGWASGAAQVADADPSTCVSPSASTASLTFSAPTDTAGAFALEVSAAVDPSNSNPQAALWLGPTSTGVPFRVGPNNDTGAAQVRFITTNLSQLSTVNYQANGSPRVALCHLRRTLLRFREQADFVRQDGAHERYTKVGASWVAAPGVRNQLFDLTAPEGGPGYRIVRPDGSELHFAKLLGPEQYRITRISDAQGRSLLVDYVSGTNRLATVTEEGAPQRALTFAYQGDYLQTIADWSGRVWRYTVDTNGDLVEYRDPLIPPTEVGTTYLYESGHVGNPDLNHNLERVTLPKDGPDPGSGGDRWTEFTYFNDDKVESHTDSLGNRQSFLFNLVRLENQATDPRGFTTIYRHDLDGNLVQRRDPDGAIWDWEYDADRNLIREVDPLGRVREFSNFDAKGNPGTITDRDGRQISIQYFALTGAPATVVDKRGVTRTTQYTADGLPENTRTTLNGVPNVLLSTNFYDGSSRQLTRTTEPLGDGTGRVRDTRLFYEEAGDPTDRDLSRVESRDENDVVIAKTEYDYDVLGRPRFQRVEREVSSEDGTLIQLVTETQYNVRDQVERVIRPDGTAQVVEYDENGNVMRQLLEETRPDGTLVIHSQTQMVYDALDRVVASIDAAGGTTSYGYDASGNRVTMTDPEGHVFRTEYDAMNRPIRVVDPNGAVTETRYDEAGQVVATVDATGIETAHAYDAVGRLVSYQFGNRPAATREIIYDGTAYEEELTDPEGRVTKFEFDELGRVFKTTDAANGQTLVGYNLLGSAKTVTDPAGMQTSFSFDELGRTVSIDPPYAGIETLVYDQTGNVVRRQKPDLCHVAQDYDAMGRLVARRTANGAGSCANAPVDEEFGYDARGLLVAAQNDDVGLIREYDVLGRMLREIDTRFGTGVGYAYDAASRLASKVYPDGSSVHYAYDGAGRTVGISDPFGETTRFVYDAAGRRLQKLGTQGNRTEYSYDLGTGWLMGVTSFDKNGGVASAFTYPTYDDVGNRLSMTETSGGSTSYTYDALDRLSTLNPPDEAIYPATGAETHFAYDAAGNRTDFGPKSGSTFTLPHTTYAYQPASKRLTTITTTPVSGPQVIETLGSYDGNGNPGAWTPPGQTQRSLKYDALGRLVEISGGFTATYVYDPFGRRIEKTEQGTTTRYQYDGLDVVAEYSATQLQATYVFGPGIDEVLKLKRGTTVAAYHTDGLGSVASITDSTSGASLKTYRYDAFGKPIAQTGSLPNAYTYTGRELDGSGLYYYRARYYLPSAGRFLTPDPIGLAGGINAYAYVNSNPVNYTDPFGLFAGQALGPAWPDVRNPLTVDPYHPASFDPSFRVETRSYAPFSSFAHLYPPYFGFLGDDRGPSADLGASSRIHGDVLVRPSSGYVGPLLAYSDLTIPSELPLPALRETPQGTLNFERLDRGVRLSIDLAGSDPWYFGTAPDIDIHTIASLSIERDVLVVEVWQFGDQFPNSDVVVRDSRGRGVVVHSFETSYGPQTGPAMLMGDNYEFMGHSSMRLPLDSRGSFRCPPVCAP